ncbi:MAG: hypothetical protein ABJP45_13235 [Cyclobacteriaceae bacterium]
MAQTVKNSNTSFSRGGTICLLCFFILVLPSSSQELSYSVEKDFNNERYGQIFIEGINEQTIDLLLQKGLSDSQWASFFKVNVAGATRLMLGSYEVYEGKVSFRPRFLPDQTVSYEIAFSSPSLKALSPTHLDTREYKWTVGFEELYEEINEVVEVFPKTDLVPANLLRLYVHFSNPVNFENPHKYIRIETNEGKLVEEPFVEMEQGLWSSDRRRLTLLIHPGRVKRNVGPNLTMGEVFEVGKSYNLIVSGEWNLEKDYVKSFQVAAAIRSTIDVKFWKVLPPKIGTIQNLTIETDKLLDNALSERLLSILDKTGKTVSGQFVYNSEASNLTFTPDQVWSAGNYAINVDPRLEDVCGNTPITVFDVEGEGSKEKNPDLRIQFRTRQ